MLPCRVLLAAMFSLCVFASAQESNPLSGYVTKADSSGAFDVEGVHVLVTQETGFGVRTRDTLTGLGGPRQYFIGEQLEVDGALDQKTHTLKATRVIVPTTERARIHGIAVIDGLPRAGFGQSATERTVRADGYLLVLNAKTKLTLDPELKSLADVSTNQWIAYSGVQQPDGTVLCEKAQIGVNKVKKTEEKLRDWGEYDPSAVTEADRQDPLAKLFLGTDARRIPPYNDPGMQSRVERIGESLVPAYQRALPDSDPTKIDFQFQVVDSTAWRDAIALPSGIIVVPRQVVERMENDDQLAAVLADNIAEVYEKHQLRLLHTMKVGLAADLATVAIPGVGLATSLTVGYKVNQASAQGLAQSGRVSLQLMHDAGYNITEAPRAYWLLGSSKPEPIEKIKMPARAANLYQALGTTWRPVMDAGDSAKSGATKGN